MHLDVNQTLVFGSAAMRRIRMHQTSAQPRIYELWYAYSSGNNRALNVAVDEIFARRPRDINRELENLYDQFFAIVPAVERVAAIEERFQAEVTALGSALETASSTGELYSASLDGAMRALPAAAVNAETLRMVTTNLIDVTRQMQQANNALTERLAASRQEVDELQHTLSAIRAEAMTDPLTSLANRRAFDAAMKAAMNGAVEDGAPFSLVIADIDRFKQFNDTHGHLFGDQVLRLVALVIKAKGGPGAVAARFGGEEFALILPGIGGKAALAVAERIRTDVKAKSVVNRGTGERLGRLTLSAGVASFRPGDNIAGIIGRADACLYVAKNGGRDQVVADTTLSLPLTA